MQTETQETYIALMREIKYRANVIEQFGANPELGMYKRTRIEFISLQLRMILENIAMACLVANGEELGKISQGLAKEYRPDRILRKIELINPSCYPQPVYLIEKPLESESGLDLRLVGRYQGEIKDRSGSDWLMREEIGAIYGRLGQILHARNPLARNADLNYFEVEGPRWYNKIVNLVTHHKVAIVNDQSMYIVVVGHANDGSNMDLGVNVQMTEWHRLGNLATISELGELPHQSLPGQTG